MTVIILTGTPGTGKTKIAKVLAKKLKYKYLDVNQLIKINKLREEYDKKRKTYEIDIKKLNKVLINEIKENENLVIDSHLSHYLLNNYVDLCVVASCDLKTLGGRLKRRKYPKLKIDENMDAEIFEVCYTEALENRHKVIVINTNLKLKENIDKIIKMVYK